MLKTHPLRLFTRNLSTRQTTTLLQRCFLSTTSIRMTTVSDVIKQDHRELEAYYNEIMKATDEDTTTRWQNQFVWELARHSIGEELVVYPAFEKYITNGGKEMADKDRVEHSELKIQLKKFQNMSPTDPEFRPTIENLMTSLKAHIAEEENDDLPALETGLKKAENAKISESLAKSFERTKMFVPTRSHPSVPNKPPFETVVGLMAAPLDKLADVFRRFPQTAAEGLDGNDK